MNHRHDPTPVVRAWLREVPGLADRDALARRVRDLVHETPQRRSSWLGSSARRVPAPRSRRRSSMLPLVAAAAIVAAGAGALLLAAALAWPSVPTPSPQSTKMETQRIAGDGPVLTWTPVDLDFDLVGPYASKVVMRSGDLFVLRADELRMRTSRDGLSWSPLTSMDPAMVSVMDNLTTAPMEPGEKRVWSTDGSATLNILESGGVVTVRQVPDGMREVVGSDYALFAGGPLGLLWVDRDTGMNVFSQDGTSWGLSRVPVSWSEGDFTSWTPVVGVDSALMAVHRCDDDGPNRGDGTRCWEGVSGRQVPGTLWRGTLESVLDRATPDARTGTPSRLRRGLGRARPGPPGSPVTYG